MITRSKLNNVLTLVSTLEHSSSLVVLVLGITLNFHTSLVLVSDPFPKWYWVLFKTFILAWCGGVGIRFEGDPCLL